MPFIHCEGQLLQAAVFVDAGYLYAQGSVALVGQKQPRLSISLDASLALAKISEVVQKVSPGSRLLRVYWYDGLARGGRPSPEQVAIANSPYTKLKVGMVNSHGQQKGVDSLIVTDLIDLARNRAITDAILIAGDEDLRIGVQIAQTFGVQTHLIGIKPAKGSQSPDLIQEADTHHEWDEKFVGEFMTVSTEEEVLGDKISYPETASGNEAYSEQLAVKEMCATLDNIQPDELNNYLETFKIDPNSVPRELDKATLGRLKFLTGGDLTPDQVRAYRKLFRDKLSNLC